MAVRHPRDHPLTGPKGKPTFVPFTINDPAASTYDSVRDFQGGAGNGWQAAPEGEVEEGSPRPPSRPTWTWRGRRRSAT